MEGTTGYEFLNDATAVFVDPSAEAALTALAREPRPFAEVAHEAKLEQATTTFSAEVDWLRRLDDCPSIREGLALLPVYRTYVDPVAGTVDDLDRAVRRRAARSRCAGSSSWRSRRPPSS